MVCEYELRVIFVTCVRCATPCNALVPLLDVLLIRYTRSLLVVNTFSVAHRNELVYNVEVLCDLKCPSYVIMCVYVFVAKTVENMLYQ